MVCPRLSRRMYRPHRNTLPEALTTGYTEWPPPDKPELDHLKIDPSHPKVRAIRVYQVSDGQ